MPISASIERTLFKDKDGGGGGGGGETRIAIIKDRFLSFLIWQFLQSTCIFFIFKTIFLSPFTAKPFTPTFLSLLSFLAIHFSHLHLFSFLFSLPSHSFAYRCFSCLAPPYFCSRRSKFFGIEEEVESLVELCFVRERVRRCGGIVCYLQLLGLRCLLLDHGMVDIPTFIIYSQGLRLRCFLQRGLYLHLRKDQPQQKQIQLCSWCARIVASLTARSLKEDRFGVAQLSGSNTAVISTLLSSPLAVETLIGKKTNIPSAHDLMGPTGIKWATVNTGRRESTSSTMGKIRGSPVYAEAYALADILRSSIYLIVSAFHDEMLSCGKAGVLEKDWIISSKPLYGTRELLLQKLHLFLDFQAN